MPEPSVEEAVNQVNWPQIYRDLKAVSFERSDRRILGVVNRARIWQTCTTIANEYFRGRPAKPQVHEGIPNLSITQAIRLSWPIKSQYTYFETRTAVDWSQVGSSTLRIVASWNNGYLASLSLDQPREVNALQTTYSVADNFQKNIAKTIMCIETENWLEGIILTLPGCPPRENGIRDAKGLIRPPPASVIGITLLCSNVRRCNRAI